MQPSDRSEQIEQTKQLIATKDFNKAILECNEIIVSDENYIDAYILRGIAYYKLKEYDKAIIDYNKAIALDENNALVYTNKGIVYEDLKNYDRAILDYNKAIELDDNYALAYYNRGHIYSNIKNYDRAILDYSKVIALEENFTLAYNNRGLVYENLKEYDKAILDYNKAIELDENLAFAYNNRGIVFYNIKKYKEAILDYTKAIELDKNLAFAYWGRGDVYFSQKEFEKAIYDYQKAKELGDDDVFYQSKIEKAEIALKEQKTNQENPKRKNVSVLVEEIQKELLFEEERICHYTSLEVLKLLIDINKPSKLRFSHIDLLNDATEGIAFYDYLFDEDAFFGLEIKNRASFIGSFVESTNNNNLSMWRAYGNDAQGVSICLNKSVFQVRKKESLENNTEVRPNQEMESDRSLYHVAYLDKAENMVYVDYKENTAILEKLEKIKEIIDVNRDDNAIKEPLERINFLFKDAIFKDERELRFFEVLPNDSTSIKWDVNFNPPRTFIELDSDIGEKITSITIGPKAKNAPGWSAFFETQLAKLGNKEVEITQSKMPYR